MKISDEELEEMATKFVDNNIYAESHTAFIAGAEMILNKINKESKNEND